MKIGDITDKNIRYRAITLATSKEGSIHRRIFSLTDESSLDAEEFELDTAFCWEDSLEGYDYWFSVNSNEVPKSKKEKSEVMCPEESAEKGTESEHILPKHYDNEHGSLYKIAKQRGWDAYQFDAIKRIDRMYKKGELERDIEKTKTVLDMAKAKI